MKEKVSVLLLFLLSVLYLPLSSSEIAWNFQEGAYLNSHNDVVIIVVKNSIYPYRLICFNNIGTTTDQWLFFRSNDIEGPWELYYTIDVPNQETPQWARENETGYWYIYTSYLDSQTRLYIGNPDLTNVTLWGTVFTNLSDSGGFYDPETGLWHIFFEADPVADDPCGWSIGHATSPNGKTDWTFHPHAINLTALGYDWHTGDPDIIKIDDTYYMFVDHTDPSAGHHPYYYIHCFKSNDLYNWTEVGQVTFRYGGDACVRYIPEKGKFYMFNEYWNAPQESCGYQIFTPSQRYVIDPKYNRMDIYISDIKPQLLCVNNHSFDTNPVINDVTPTFSWSWNNITFPVSYDIWVYSTDGDFNYTITNVSHADYLAGDHIEYTWGSKGEPPLLPGKEYHIRVKCRYKIGVIP